jgi:hypothetical protein
VEVRVAHDRFEFEVIGPQRGSDLDQIKSEIQERIAVVDRTQGRLTPFTFCRGFITFLRLEGRR